MRLNGSASEAIQPRGEGAKPDWLTAVRLYNQAIEAFNRALELNPADRIIRIGLMTALKDQAEAYRQLDEYDLAERITTGRWKPSRTPGLSSLKRKLFFRPDIPNWQKPSSRNISGGQRPRLAGQSQELPGRQTQPGD